MSKKRGHAQHEEHMDESWLIPYADLLTLLLALFIVLFASSSVDASKFAAMAQAFAIEFGGSAGIMPGHVGLDIPLPPTLSGEGTGSPGEDDPEGDTVDKELEDFIRLRDTLRQHFEAEGLNANFDLIIDERGLVISLRDSVLFDSGKAIIKREFLDMLTQVGVIINRLENYIRVEGHTDNIQLPANSVYLSNWELSGDRAAAVIHLFADVSGIDQKKLSMVGHGEQRPKATNDTPEGRAANRRVDIIIQSSMYSAIENAPMQ